MAWVAPAYITLLVVTILLGASMFSYAMPRRGLPGGRPLLFVLGLIVLWATCVLGEIGSAAFSTKLLFFNLRQITLVTLPVVWLVLSTEVYMQDYWRRGLWLAGLLVFPLVTLALGFVNHPLLRENVRVANAYGLRIIVAERGAWVMLETAYSYTLILLGIILLIDLIRRTVPRQRHQTAALVIGIILTIVGNLLDLLGINPISPLSPMLLMLMPTALLFMWGLFRYQQLDVLPVAHDRVLEAIADGVMVINRAGKIVDLNRSARDLFARMMPNHAEMLGKTVAEGLAGWPEWPVHVPETRPNFEVTHKSADGQVQTFEVEVSTLTAPRGEVLGQIMLINDVTAEKQTFEFMAERERIEVLQKFIRDASHDLRTPMSVIQSSSYLMKRLADKQIENLASLHPRLPQVYAAIIEDAIDMTGKLRDRAVAADDAAKRLWSILSGMIELAELEAGGALEKQPVDFNLIVESVMTSRRSECERRGVGTGLTLGTGIPEISADERRLSRAIDAVVLNALQYTLRGGSVSVMTEYNDTMVCVVVKDNGIGIGAEDLPRIYDRFFRADPARSIETGGAGLGLPLVKSVIEAHGGSISVESEVGVGSTFRLYVPIHKT